MEATQRYSIWRLIPAFLLATYLPARAETNVIAVTAAQFTPGPNMSAIDGTNHLQFVINSAGTVPFSQLAVKQGTEQATLGPAPEQPYFTVRFAMPIPPAYTKEDVAALTGMDPMVFRHNHSPGFEILPNGEIRPVGGSASADLGGRKPVTMREDLGGEYGVGAWS